MQADVREQEGVLLLLNSFIHHNHMYDIFCSRGFDMIGWQKSIKYCHKFNLIQHFFEMTVEQHGKKDKYFFLLFWDGESEDIFNKQTSHSEKRLNSQTWS